MRRCFSFSSAIPAIDEYSTVNPRVKSTDGRVGSDLNSEVVLVLNITGAFLVLGRPLTY